MFFFLILITIVSMAFVVALIIYAYKYPKRKSYFFACAWVIALGGLGVGVMLIDYEKNQAKINARGIYGACHRHIAVLLRGAVRHRTVGYESGVPRLRAFGRVCARVLR